MSTDVSAKTVIKPWVKHSWQVPQEAFSDMSVLNATVGAWEALNIREFQFRTNQCVERDAIR